MISKLFSYLSKPSVYSKSSFNFWDDEHISKHLLEAHLHPDIEAASRSHEFIKQSVDWISNVIPLKGNVKILDLGCGPGLYAHQLAEKGYQVTGLDFSKRSIDYAKKQAKENDLSINYLYSNYLDMQFENEFDGIIMIYCDYAVLNDQDRKQLLDKCYRALKKDGTFIFDVFTHREYDRLKQPTTWEYEANGGFWHDKAYVCLESYWDYENDVRLEQYVLLLEDDRIDVVRNWFKAFDVHSIKEEIANANFGYCDVYANVIGEEIYEQSKTLCCVVRK